MSAIASQITGVSIVYSTVCSGADQRKHQSSASLAFVRGIHRWSVNSPHKGLVRRKMFPFDDARAGASTRFTSTSTGTSTCNMCEYEYESEYLIFTWVQVRVRVLVDEYEYKCEYRSMINILYSMYRRHIFIVRSLTRESSDSYKPGTKLHLPIVHVNYLCQYISV